MDLAEYASFDGLGLAELIRKKQVSVEEVVRAALEASRSMDPKLNAVIEDYPERVYSASPVADSPFIGVPFMLKDVGCTEHGRRSEAGSRLARGLVAEKDSDLMRRFRQAGLINIGRTATSEFAITATVETALNGVTRNPWARDRSTAGSSGGAAAVVAAGVVPIAHGTDGGGSIRMPASACGVVGLKPSRGRVSGAPHSTTLGDLTVEFALTRTVRDTAALLDAVAGPAAGDPNIFPPPETSFRKQISVAPRRLRIALCTANLWGGPIDGEVVEAARRTGRLLVSLGHDVEEAVPALSAERYMAATLDIWCAVSASFVDSLEAESSRRMNISTVEGLSRARVERGRSLTALDITRALSVLEETSRTMSSFLNEYDVFMSSTLPTVTPRLGQYKPDEEVAADWYYPSPVGNLESTTAIFNCAGQPAISLPLERSAEGLPIGIQFGAVYGQEGLLLRLAAQLEEAQPWRDSIPPTHVSRETRPDDGE